MEGFGEILGAYCLNKLATHYMVPTLQSSGGGKGIETVKRLRTKGGEKQTGYFRSEKLFGMILQSERLTYL